MAPKGHKWEYAGLRGRPAGLSILGWLEFQPELLLQSCKDRWSGGVWESGSGRAAQLAVAES
jgi:hypothetical protein